jgi:dihydrofolate reductase
MGDVHVHEFMSLDGVIDAPTWTMEYEWTPRMFDRLAVLSDSCDRILLGRNTFEMFEPAWSTRTVEDDPGAPFFNDTMKHVVSATLEETTWRNSQVLGPYDPDTIRKLKDEGDGGVYISGSITLVRAMLADGLIDDLHLLVYPLTLGAGPRLFTEGAEPGKLTLADAERFDNGVLYVNYKPQT